METRPPETPCPDLRLIVTPENVSFFTTILQYGIRIKTPAHTSLGTFLCRCPGFTEDYLLKTVQTIFLNGTAIDDLQTPLSGPHPVVALSAAMPGLAGAIFRKNGLHSTLRTIPPATAFNNKTCGPLTVTLKLFNRIAREKGELLLSLGAVMTASSVSAFLEKRPELHTYIGNAAMGTTSVPPGDLPRKIRHHDAVRLFVTSEKN